MGKTTIAHVLKDALETHEFKKVSLTDTKTTVEPKEPIEQRVQVTKERPVVIEVVSVASHPTGANAIPSIVARDWLKALKNIRPTLEGANNATQLKELDHTIEELHIFTR